MATVLICVLPLAGTAPSAVAESPQRATERLVSVNDHPPNDHPPNVNAAATRDTIAVDTPGVDTADDVAAGEERMAILIGGLKALGKEVKYPRKARKKCIKSLMFVQTYRSRACLRI